LALGTFVGGRRGVGLCEGDDVPPVGDTGRFVNDGGDFPRICGNRTRGCRDGIGSGISSNGGLALTGAWVEVGPFAGAEGKTCHT